MTIAKFRAKFGNDIELVSSSEFVKSPDAYENGKPFEYKRISEDSTNTKTSVQRSLREAKEQAGNIVIYLDRSAYDQNSIDFGVKYALEKDTKNKIKKITFLNKEGRIVYERNI